MLRRDRGGVVYRITNTVNGKTYIGVTSRSVAARWRQHRCDARRGSDLALHAAMRKYGEGDFTIETVACSWDYAGLVATEMALIRQGRTISHHGCGYNMTAGGDGQLEAKPTPEAVEKRASKRRGTKLPPAWCLAMSRAGRGRPKSEKHARAISEALKRSEKMAARLGNPARHPRSRAVRTPEGSFACITLAAKHHRINRRQVRERIAAGNDGWFYEIERRLAA